MYAGKFIKFLFYGSVAVLVFKSGEIAYSKLFFKEDKEMPSGTIHKYKLDFKEIKIPVSDKTLKTEVNNDFAYDFSKMLNLIEACEKVKYLDYLRFSRPKEAISISPETLDALVKALHQEKSKLKKHIGKIKSSSRSSVPSKRMKALKYYLRVVELNLQDLKSLKTEK